MPHNQETPTYFNLNHVASQPQIVILNQATTSSGQLDVVNECEEVDEDEEGEDDEDEEEDDNDNREEENSPLNKNENNLIFKGALFKTFDEFESKFQEFCDKTKQIYNTSKSALVKNNTNDECPYKTKLYVQALCTSSITKLHVSMLIAKRKVKALVSERFNHLIINVAKL